MTNLNSLANPSDQAPVVHIERNSRTFDFDEFFRKMPGLDGIRDLSRRRLDALNAPQMTIDVILAAQDKDLASGIAKDVLGLSNKQWQCRLDLGRRIAGLAPETMDLILPAINKALQSLDLRVAAVPELNEVIFGKLNHASNKFEQPVLIEWRPVCKGKTAG